MKCNLAQAGQVVASYSLSGNIRVIVQLVLHVEAGRRAHENEIGHRESLTALSRQILIHRKVRL